MNQDKRLIEETFPVKEVSSESGRERYIRQGHISTLHIWWARRPLASSRATAYAALVPSSRDTDEWNRKRNFIINFSKWENSLNVHLAERAHKEILEANDGTPPKVFDPFGGGGSIPLEALRLGCDTYSNDLNPVAVLIQKCTLEYPQKYSKLPGDTDENIRLGKVKANPLLEDIKKWGMWVLSEAEKELGRFYREEKDGSIPDGWLWAWTLPCQNLSCRAEIPLMRQFWLANKAKKKIALYPYIEDKKVEFKIVGDGYEDKPKDFDPKKGTISRAVVACPVCGTTIDARTTRKLFQEGKAGQRMIAIVGHKSGERVKQYRIATEADLEIFHIAEEYLADKQNDLSAVWGMSAVPDEELPLMSGVFNVPLYGINVWGDLFNSRQKLALITFVEKVKAVYQKLVAEDVDIEYAKAVVSYLALILSRHSSYNATLCWWYTLAENGFNVFGRQALPMVFDYLEQNPYGILTGNWLSQVDGTSKIVSHLSSTLFLQSATVSHSSATSIPYPNEFFDAVFTDPPYYNSVPYADLSDFFYVWLKRTIGDLYPELFSTPLAPKNQEITEMAGWDSRRYAHKDKGFFEENLKQSFQEIYRVLNPNGVTIIVYAHKSTEGWETLINSLLDSGLIMTGAWPLYTEMDTRLRANESATLTSSIYIVARKMERQPTGFYNEVKEEMKRHLNAKLHRFWEEGLGGADFFIVAIGSAIEVFGKYEKVIDFEGKVIRADRLLDDVREIATDYAVRQILHNGFAGEISDLTRFYVLWRWEYGEARVPFDEARKLAQSCGVDLAQEWGGNSFIKKEKQFIRVLGPQTRTLDDLSNTKELIDTLHKILLLWEKGQRDEMLRVLRDSSYGDSEAFYRVTQAISETLPIESREKKLLDGFLAGREKVREQVRQGLLF